MLKRLIVGLVLGTLLGGLVAAAIVFGLHTPVFSEGLAGASLAYAAAVAVGVLTGAVAGKPVWAEGGKIEAGLKAFFGALLAAGGMWAVRSFVHTTVDLTSLGVGAGEVGDLPALALPGIAAVLGAFFEIDNTGEPAKDASERAGSAKVRVATGGARDVGVDEEAQEPAAASRKRRR